MSEENHPAGGHSAHVNEGGNIEDGVKPKGKTTTRQLSRKFTVKSVSPADDPLYSKVSPSDVKLKPAEEGKEEPESKRDSDFSPGVVDMYGERPRTASLVSNAGSEQKFYSLEDVSNKSQPVIPPNSDALTNGLEATVTTVNEGARLSPRGGPSKNEGVAKVRYIKSSLTPNSKPFADSFYEKAEFFVRDDDDDVVDIKIPVPNSPPVHDNQATITSNYEQNMSINRLLRERHKPSLAAMGRLFGSKQKELNGAILLPLHEPEKKKKSACAWITPLHVALTITLLVIIAATVATIEVYEPTQLKVASRKGYVFDHHHRELSLYIPAADLPSLQVHVGEFLGGVPHNCSNSADHINSSCFTWNKDATMRISVINIAKNSTFPNEFESVQPEDGRCLVVSWKAHNTRLSDCIAIGSTNGGWYGGFLSDSAWRFGHKELTSSSSYLPGSVYGNVVERMWLSSNGTAIYAQYDRPLQIEMSRSSDKFCLSSPAVMGAHYLNYTVCASTDAKPLTVWSILRRLHARNTVIHPPAKPSLDPLCEGGTYPDFIKCKYIVRADGEENVTDSTLSSAQNGIYVSPFMSIRESLFLNDVESDAWLKAPSMDTPALFKHNNQLSVLLNTSSATFTEVLTKTGISKFDGEQLLVVDNVHLGVIGSLKLYTEYETNTTLLPHVRNYLGGLRDATTGPIMTRIASGTQNTGTILQLPPIIDIGKTVRDILLSSMMGHQILNAGVIGDANTTSTVFLRMVQLASFLPIIQYSKHVLNYDENTTAIWEQWTNARRDTIFPKILECLALDQPLYSPIWWNNPDSAEQEEFAVTDQFMFGNHTMIAPIIDPTATTRTVRLPKGHWAKKSVIHSKPSLEKGYFTGPAIITFDVPDDDLLVFEYVN